MNTVCIIQARMGSTRLPGKVLQDIAGQTMLERVVRRATFAKYIDQVIVATTTAAADDRVEAEACRLGVGTFRGSEADVLDRYYQAALIARADVVVRVTSDCPLLDPDVSDSVIREIFRSGADYVSNTISRSFPRGLDTEAMTMAALTTAWTSAQEPYEREHVTPYLYQGKRGFRIESVTAEADFSHHRWTVDTAEDVELVRAIYARLGNEPFGWRAVLALLEREPALARINAHVPQKTL